MNIPNDPTPPDCRIPLSILVTIGCALDRYSEQVSDYPQDYEDGEAEIRQEKIEAAQAWLQRQEAR